MRRLSGVVPLLAMSLVLASCGGSSGGGSAGPPEKPAVAQPTSTQGVAFTTACVQAAEFDDGVRYQRAYCGCVYSVAKAAHLTRYRDFARAVTDEGTSHGLSTTQEQADHRCGSKAFAATD